MYKRVYNNFLITDAKHSIQHSIGNSQKSSLKKVFWSKVINFGTKKVLEIKISGNEVLPFGDFISRTFFLVPVWFDTTKDVYNHGKKGLDIKYTPGYIQYTDA